MIIKNLEVSEITLTKVDNKTNDMELTVNFANETPLIVCAKLDEDFEMTIEKMIKKIKSAKLPQDTEEDSILSGITIVNIKNEEDLKEKLPKRFIMITNKLGLLNKSRTASEYMRLFQQLTTLREVLYQRNS